MATSKTIRQQMRKQRSTPVETETTVQDLTMEEKHEFARALVKSGEASNLKEAWQIMRDRGIHK